jgi:hypothetical protein
LIAILTRALQRVSSSSSNTTRGALASKPSSQQLRQIQANIDLLDPQSSTPSVDSSTSAPDTLAAGEGFIPQESVPTFETGEGSIDISHHVPSAGPDFR